MDQDELKRAVGSAAAAHIAPMLNLSSIVGVGTGSTANCFIDELASLKDQFAGAIASSNASAERLISHGIKVHDLNEVSEILVYVDGADESNHKLQLIKGGGGALTREKIVASASASFICIVDESKIVDTLGRYPLPVEVIPMARNTVARALTKLGCEPRLRAGFITDNGNQILDLHDLVIEDALLLESLINNITGVVTVGLFAARSADVLLVGTPRGVELIRKP